MRDFKNTAYFKISHSTSLMLKKVIKQVEAFEPSNGRAEVLDLLANIEMDLDVLRLWTQTYFEQKEKS